MDTHDLESKVRALVADCLAIEPDKIDRESRLVDDLGADSLDFIDLLFLIEKEFGVKVRDSELDFLSRLDFSSPEVMRNGHLTPETVARLAEWLPALRSSDPATVKPAALFGMLTVETLAIMIRRKLEA
jgi:acyl carrier protein